MEKEIATGNPYAIEKRAASDSEDNVSVVSTHDGDTYDSDSNRHHNFWTRIMFTKLVDACKEMQDYLDNKWWQKITGENIIEDTLKEFQDAKHERSPPLLNLHGLSLKPERTS